MIDLDLAPIKARADAATPGPWYRVGMPWNRDAAWVNAGSPDPHQLRFVCDLDPTLAGDDRDEDEPGNEVADAEFIAHARTDVPALLARIAELEAEREELRGQRDEARRMLRNLTAVHDRMRPVVEAAEAWLAHVRGPDAFLRKPNAELIKLADAVDAWRAAQPDQKAETVGDGLDALETLNRIAYGEAPETAPESTQADEQGADDGAGTEGSQAQGGAQGAQCRAEYKRPGPPEPGDRIVRCGRRKGHRGDHDEMIEGEAGNWWPQEPAPADPAGLDAAIEAAAQAISRYDWNAGLSRRVTVSDCQRDEADAAVRAAAPHLRAAALNEAAAAFREDFDSRKLYLGAEFSVWLMQYQRAGRIGGGE